jgi:hypothetical protein
MQVERPPRGLTLGRVWIRQNRLMTTLIIFILISLLLHALTIGSLVRIRNTVSRQLDISVAQLARIRQQRVHYDLPVEQTFMLNTTFPISETISVPLSMTVPISQTIELPVNTPVGRVNLDVPLDFTVPITDEVDVLIERQIPVQAEIPIETDIPIDFALDEPPLGEILEQLEQGLRDLRDNLYR